MPNPIVNIQEEFQRQVDNLLQKKYPEKLKITSEAFLKYLQPLESKLNSISPTAIDLEEGKLPFVIVIKSDLLSSEQMMELVDFHGESGMVNLFPNTPPDFKPIERIFLPNGMAYLLVDIDRGKQTLNVRPNEALETIEIEGRTPLTIDEGIALITQFPEFLIKNNCFSLLGSRGTDQKVPAIWISQKKPRLGWCWAGNPHTWLGSASGKNRL